MTKEQITTSAFALGFAALTVLTQEWSTLIANKGPAYLNPPPEMIEHFTFGFGESIADSLWLRWIQDGDACQTYVDAAPVAPDPQDGHATPESNFFNPRYRKCDASWSFKMLDAVTRMAPKFRMPYAAGAMTLSVLVEDYQGSTVLFDRAVENFPDDWQMLYRAGYHFLFDVHDLARAGELMNRAADHGAPYWVKMLAARVFTRNGQLEIGITTLENYLRTVDREDRRAEVKRKIAELRRLAAEKPAAEP